MVEGGRSPSREGNGSAPPHLQTLLEVFFAREYLGQVPMVHLHVLQRSFPSLSFIEFRTRRFFQAFYNVQDCILQAEI